ncbi:MULTISPECIES: helix-turn-helix domain-containing protein [Asticcacaulis]|uniref:helix-turn-helix domain-containing protein n=1 Tax=Asticcacaulis TaxID=76890 RepID=UPI001AEB1585|nr:MULTISPECIES: helix-turn-helix transcriptional regulator [Asticcacaulis]MBP2161638.1 transcriptional regulator with XRE-family HTH domain [Asticcacaulis solisilvae]MDR6802737.1 transcriptional regulator with XRE-family HTH domain [Asticcacaulis sp. BE141]
MADLLTIRRKEAGLTQVQVASALGRLQPFIANIENGERRVDLVELIALSKIIGFDLHEFVSEIESTF